MDGKLLIALAGVIVAAMTTELNDAVTAQLLGPISGSLGFSHDPGTWFESLYVTFEIFGMAISPWFVMTLSLRRWSLFVIVLTCMSTILIPTTRDLTVILGLRAVQGLCGGLAIPLLMTTALRALPPPIRLYGLAAYSLTATFFPSLATAIAGLWLGTGDGPLGWQFAFYQAVPLAVLGFVLVWYGMPADPPHYDRFGRADWRGFVLLVLGFGALSTMLQQGDRLDWFNSLFVCVLALTSVVAIPLLLINEWFHPEPLLKLQLLGRRNIAYGVIGLFTFLLIALAGSTLPNNYLSQVQDFLPAQSYSDTTLVAASQLVLLPLMAVLLNLTAVDARLVSLVGLICIVGACAGASNLSDVWQPGQFYLWQGLISIGEASVVMPLLMLSTNSVKSPSEGPYVSSLVNTPRAVGEATGTWLLQLIGRWRGEFHSSRLDDQIGIDRFRVVQGPGVLPNDPSPMLASGAPRAPGSIGGFYAQVQQQVDVLTTSDAYLVLGALAIGLMVVLLTLTQYSPPPRIALAKS